MLKAVLENTCVEPDLAEWGYGAYEGLLTSEIWHTNPGWNVFRDRCPGGEALPLVVARADRLLLRLKAMPGSIACSLMASSALSWPHAGPALPEKRVSILRSTRHRSASWVKSRTIPRCR